MSFGRVIFGDNQFLGVNHSSQKKATELYSHYTKTDNILETLNVAYSSGIRDFMFTSHTRYDEVFEEIVRSNCFPGMSFIPCVPYAHKYWSMISEIGLLGTFYKTSKRGSLRDFYRIPYGILSGQLEPVISSFIKVEIYGSKGLNISGVFLQNAATDFILALGLNGLLEDYYRAVDRMGLTPGFITMNTCRATETLVDDIGLSSPWICSNYNVSGFRMHPNKQVVENCMRDYRTKNIAMSIFASGKLGGKAAIDHALKGLNDGLIDSVLFGSSSENNIRNTFQSIIENSG